MNELERTLTKALSDKDGFDAVRSETIRKEIVQMFEDKLKRVYRYARMWLTVCIVMMVVFAALFGFAASFGVRGIWGMVAASVFYLVVGQLVVTVKLWYWIMNNKLSVLKEIKELQLQIAEMVNQKPSAES